MLSVASAYLGTCRLAARTELSLVPERVTSESPIMKKPRLLMSIWYPVAFAIANSLLGRDAYRVAAYQQDRVQAKDNQGVMDSQRPQPATIRSTSRSDLVVTAGVGTA